VVTMSPLTHKIIVGMIASVSAAGIIAMSNVIIKNNETSARIEAKVGDISTDFDRFVDLRYQADMDQIDRAIASVNARVDVTQTP
jgi:hypothetical protein